ncbi:MAG: ImmA/IrrE family metallo-endopeptidase [Deltaproteobacteria bacterium]|jgi:Zn-dependent peptidase ImmA (M78 family)
MDSRVPLDVAYSNLPSPAAIASDLIARANITSPPVDPQVVVRLWPNLDIIEEDLDGDGYLIPVGADCAEIIVSRNFSPRRRRFTAAHELGHWVLQQRGLAPRFENDPAIERWCDAFAASILMPEPWILSYLGDWWNIGSVKELAEGYQHFGVSMPAFHIRATEVGGVDIAYRPARGVEQRTRFHLQRSTYGLAERIVREVERQATVGSKEVLRLRFDLGKRICEVVAARSESPDDSYSLIASWKFLSSFEGR